MYQCEKKSWWDFWEIALVVNPLAVEAKSGKTNRESHRRELEAAIKAAWFYSSISKLKAKVALVLVSMSQQ